MSKTKTGRVNQKDYNKIMAKLVPFVATEIYGEKLEPASDEQIARRAVAAGMTGVTNRFVRTIRAKLGIPNADERYRSRIAKAFEDICQPKKS